MEAIVALVLLLGLVVGGLTLMLAAGFVSTEKARAQQAEERRAAEVSTAAVLAGVPAFFVPPRPVVPAMPFVFDDALVSRLENHVRLEQAVVAQFVHHPSIDTLYRQTGTPLHVH
jgi:hypothetical protein